MSEIIEKLRLISQTDLKNNDNYQADIDFINENIEYLDNPGINDCLGGLLIYYFEANKRSFEDSSFNGDIQTLQKIFDRYSRKISPQAKLNIIQSFAIILLKCGKDCCAKNKVIEYIYTLFKEMRVGTRKNVTAFSFRPFSTYALKDICLKKLTLSNPSVFNDPFDTLLPHWLKYTLKQSVKNVDNYKYQVMLQDMCKYIRVRSFVSAKDIKDLNPLMWAHYADEHRGFCVRYEFDKEFFEIDDKNRRVCVWKKMKYVTNEYRYKPQIATSEALLTKDKIWEYEHESRILLFDPSKQENFVPIPLGNHARITDIYLGMRFSPDNVRFMKSLIKDSGIELHQMKEDENYAFKLNCKEVE